MIAITGATGQLGQQVIKSLLENTPPGDIVAVVRNPTKAQYLKDQGVQVRVADYNDKKALTAAFADIEKLLLISSSEVGQRAPQHRNAIESAKEAGVALIAYTSLLHADTSPLGLAAEHRETEKKLADSGIPFVLLRNGWYTENHLASVPAALEHGAYIGSAGNGKISSASRADYALAAVRVLTTDNQAGRIYELAGDTAWTLSDLTAAISELTGKKVVYQHLSEADYNAALTSAGLPPVFANLLADCDAGAEKGALFDDSHQLSTLIGRPTTPFKESLKAIV